MNWYAASIVTVIEVLEGEQLTVPVEEAIYLLQGNSREFARKAAMKIGKALEVAGAEGIRWCERPARLRFLGIRKLRAIYPPTESNTSIDDAVPVHGAEITHSFFEVDSSATAELFAQGKRVAVSYVDDDA